MGRQLTMEDLRGLPQLPKPGEFYTEDESGELVWVESVYDFRSHDDGTPAEPDEKEREEEYPFRVEFLFGDEDRYHAHYLSSTAFARDFTLAPDGAARIDAEIEAAAQDIAAEQRRVINLGSSMRALGVGTESSEAPLALTSTAGLLHAAELKRKVAEVRNETAKVAKALKVKQERTNLLIQKQQRAMQARTAVLTAALKARMQGMTAELEQQMAAMKDMLDTAQETIWTINLYLGKNETVVQLQKGEPAPSDTPIALRQRRLFMDEESAINADDGGIDFKSIEQFDAWVVEPAHLQQVLPERKGVVAIKVRRAAKKYSGTAHENARLNALNSHTYFLMRNGDNIYRIDSDLEVGDVLFPREDEFAELFEKREYDRSAGEHRTVKLEPGSEEYMKALKAVGETERHYLRIFLFLQGLLDRTPLFHSRPDDANRRINVFDMLRQDDHIQFVRDAEEKRLLGHTRPPFDAWLASVNARLDVGCRIVGHFPQHFSQYEEKRIKPEQADGPDNDAIHTIARTERGSHEDKESFVFLYQRGDTVYRRSSRWDYQESGPAKTRASYKVYADDEFLINVDGAALVDMEFYLSSRTERHAYAKMFPVLKRAIALKREEAEAEAPFRAALVGMLMRERGVDEPTALAAVDELVAWWKFKNHTHRALLSDDKKASRMILREYGLRRTRDRERRTIDQDAVVRQLVGAGVVALAPEPIYIAHKSGNEFVVLRPMNDENIFVGEETWTVGKGGVDLTEEKHWAGIDSRRLRWQPLYATPRFDEFVKDVRMDQYLTDPEEDFVIATARERIAARFQDGEERSVEDFRSGRQHTRQTRCRLLRVTRTPKRQLDLWAQVTTADIPDRLLTDDIAEPRVTRFHITWVRTKAGLAVRDDDGSTMHSYQLRAGDLTLWQDAAAEQEFRADEQSTVMAELHIKRLNTLVSALVEQIGAAAEKRRHDALLAEFLVDHGDMELWDDHLDAQNLRPLHWAGFQRFLAHLVEENPRAVHGMTVEAAVTAGYTTYARIWQERHEPKIAAGTSFSGYFAPDPLELPAWTPLDLVLAIPDDWAADLKLTTPPRQDDEDVDDYVERITSGLDTGVLACEDDD